MNLGASIAATVISGALLLGASAWAQSPAGSPAPSSAPTTAAPPPPFTTGRTPPVGELKSLGKDRYQVGRIVVDKRAGRFTVPGRVHLLDHPLEFLVTTPGGMKEYETLLEVDATGSEFNLACILLGLERDPRQGSFHQFSEVPLVGPRVLVSITWQDKGKRREVSAAEALINPSQEVRPESVEWVYTGSTSSQPDGQFAADITGTLIGFVHSPNTIIDSVAGLGIGAYGSVSGNASVLPPVGTPIEVVVQLSREKAKPAGP